MVVYIKHSQRGIGHMPLRRGGKRTGHPAWERRNQNGWNDSISWSHDPPPNRPRHGGGYAQASPAPCQGAGEDDTFTGDTKVHATYIVSRTGSSTYM